MGSGVATCEGAGSGAGSSPQAARANIGAITVRVSRIFFTIISRLERFCAGDDFNQFGGNRRLTAAVVLDRQLVDQFTCIASGVVHGGH